ncbi:MAG: hypothetical protein SGILL_000909 [Bacillariaceae sp.]
MESASPPWNKPASNNAKSSKFSFGTEGASPPWNKPHGPLPWESQQPQPASNNAKGSKFSFGTEGASSPWNKPHCPLPWATSHGSISKPMEKENDPLNMAKKPAGLKTTGLDDDDVAAPPKSTHKRRKRSPSSRDIQTRGWGGLFPKP